MKSFKYHLLRGFLMAEALVVLILAGWQIALGVLFLALLWGFGVYLSLTEDINTDG